MSQLYEKKCDCKYYDDLNEHGATLLKMELPEYETPGNGLSYVICRALRFMGYVTVVVLLSYSLWRIHVIESTLAASDRLHNLTRTIALESSRLNHNRVTRSVPLGHHADVNSIGTGKDLPRGSMLTAKNEFVPAKRRRPADDREFEYLVHSLLDKIQTMHNDTDRAHLGSNMKALFQAWFPVFDALLPEELVEDEIEPLASITGSIKERVERSVNEEDEGIKPDWHKLERNFASKDRMNFILTHMRQPPTDTDDEQGNSNEESIDDKSSEMNEEQFSDDNEQEILDALAEIDKNSKTRSKGRIHRLVRSIADETSEESSQEKKQTITELFDAVTAKASEESSEEKKPRTTRSVADKTSEESSEEKKQRFVRSVFVSSDESKSSSEEEKRRVKYNKNNKSKESTEEEEKKEDKSKKKEKSSEESIESSESAESKEKKNKEKNELFYQVVSLDQDGSKTIVQVD